jgi:hypothetical protein
LVARCDDFFDDGRVNGEVICAGAEDADGVLVLRGERGIAASSDDVIVEVGLDIDGCVFDCDILESVRAMGEETHEFEQENCFRKALALLPQQLR